MGLLRRKVHREHKISHAVTGTKVTETGKLEKLTRTEQLIYRVRMARKKQMAEGTKKTRRFAKR